MTNLSITRLLLDHSELENRVRILTVMNPNIQFIDIHHWS